MPRSTRMMVAIAMVIATALTGAQGAQAAEPSITPQGGCIGPICGHVVNLLSRPVLVTMRWCCEDNRWVYPSNGTSGWGDVDGVYVPKGCTYTVTKNFVTVTWPQGWHRIHTVEFVVVRKAICRGPRS